MPVTPITVSVNGKKLSGNGKTCHRLLGHPQCEPPATPQAEAPKKVMNATRFDVSLTALSTIGLRRVTLVLSTWELFDHPEIRSDSAGVDRMSGRCFWPYIQDPPVVLGVTVRSAII
jgi:hypothetical protein